MIPRWFGRTANVFAASFLLLLLAGARAGAAGNAGLSAKIIPRPVANGELVSSNAEQQELQSALQQAIASAVGRPIAEVTVETAIRKWEPSHGAGRYILIALIASPYLPGGKAATLAADVCGNVRVTRDTPLASVPGGRVVRCGNGVVKAVVLSRANVYVWVNTNWLNARQIGQIATTQYRALPKNPWLADSLDHPRSAKA